MAISPVLVLFLSALVTEGLSPSLLFSIPVQGERGKSVALNSFLPFRNFGGAFMCLSCLASLRVLYTKREKAEGVLPLRLSLL